jgi:hypothetical protein
MYKSAAQSKAFFAYSEVFPLSLLYREQQIYWNALPPAKKYQLNVRLLTPVRIGV